MMSPFRRFPTVHYFLVSAGLVTLLAAQPGLALSSKPQTDDEKFLGKVQKQTFRYFLYEYHPTTGLINDSAKNGRKGVRDRRTSVAATGFGINAFIIGADRGWISKKEAYERIHTTARFFDERAETEHGFFYHFLDGKTGKNAYKSELSSIDTAILLAGLLTARQYFPDTELAGRVERIYRRVDFDWMRNRTPFISMGWDRERGFFSSYWSSFDEGLLLYILAIGSPTHPVPPETWRRVKKPVLERQGETFVFAGPLFIHQYPHVWLDLKNKNDGVTDYFENSIRATRANKRFAQKNAKKYKTYAAGYWGLSAFDGPTGYKAYGAADDTSHDGTVSPMVAGTSLVFTPDISIAQMRKAYKEHKAKMWGRYGFSDSMNLERDWFSEITIGIDAGALVSMIENYQTGLLWKLFMKNVEVVEGLRRAGFVEGTMEPSIALSPAYNARYTETAPVIDGDASDWSGVDAIRLEPKHLDYGIVSDSRDLSGTVSFVWDDVHLYLWAEITDDEVVAKRTVRHSYKDDLLELFFDLDRNGFRWKDRRDPQLGFSFDPKTRMPRLYNWGDEREIRTDQAFTVAMVRRPQGYMIEAALPWDAFDIKPSDLLTLAITPAVHDLDGETEESKLSWYFRDRGPDKGVELGNIVLKK